VNRTAPAAFPPPLALLHRRETVSSPEPGVWGWTAVRVAGDMGVGFTPPDTHS
jgi:hypothetical protein